MQFSFSDFTMSPQEVRTLYLFPVQLPSLGGNGTIITRDPYLGVSDLTGTLYISNVVAGIYRGEFRGRLVSSTNFFSFPTTNGLIYARDWLVAPINYPAGAVAWATAVSDGRYVFKNNGAATNLSLYGTNGIWGELDLTNNAGTSGQMLVSAGPGLAPFWAALAITKAQLESVEGGILTTNNGLLTSGRVMLGDGARGLSVAAASGPVPIDADGSAATVGQMNTLFGGGGPVTNFDTRAWTNNSTTGFSASNNGVATLISSNNVFASGANSMLSVSNGATGVQALGTGNLNASGTVSAAGVTASTTTVLGAASFNTITATNWIKGAEVGKPNDLNIDVLPKFFSALALGTRPVRILTISDLGEWPGGSSMKQSFWGLLGDIGGLISGGALEGDMRLDLSGISQAIDLTTYGLGSGLYTVTNGSLMTWSRRSLLGSPGLQDTNWLATKALFWYLKETNAGTFKIQTNYQGGGWSDMVTIPCAIFGTNTGYTNLTLPSGYYSIRIVGVSGTCRIIDGGIWNDAKNGLLLGGLSITSRSIVDLNNCPTNCIWPVFNQFNPDLLIVMDTDGAHTPSDWPLFQQMVTNACTNADVLICGNHYVVTDLIQPPAFNAQAQSNALAFGWGFFDTFYYFGTNFQALTNWGLLNTDGVHLTTAGVDYLNGKLFGALMNKNSLANSEHVDSKFLGAEVNLLNSVRYEPLGIGVASPDKNVRVDVQCTPIASSPATHFKLSGQSQIATLYLQGNYALDTSQFTNITFAVDANGALYIAPTWPSGAGGMGNIYFGQPFPGKGLGTWYADGNLVLGPSSGLVDPGGTWNFQANNIVSYFGSGFIGSGALVTNIPFSGLNQNVAGVFTNNVQGGAALANNLWILRTNGTLVTTGVTNSALTASRVMLSDANKAESSAAASGAVPIDADGSASTFAQVNALAPGTVMTNGMTGLANFTGGITNNGTLTQTGNITNGVLTASRMVLSDANKALASAAASGAVPIDADGSATTFAQVNTLAPSAILTNGFSPSPVFFAGTIAPTNGTIFYTNNYPIAGQVSWQNLNGGCISWVSNNAYYLICTNTIAHTAKTNLITSW